MSCKLKCNLSKQVTPTSHAITIQQQIKYILTDNIHKNNKITKNTIIFKETKLAKMKKYITRKVLSLFKKTNDILSD